MPSVETGKPRARRGFAAMNPERRREIARKGGASVPGEKRSFAKDRDLAASAGRKGGEASRGGGRTRGREIYASPPLGAQQHDREGGLLARPCCVRASSPPFRPAREALRR